MSYNLLADLYADSDFSRTSLHPQCPPYALAIDYRKQLMLKEVLGFHADIVCLVRFFPRLNFIAGVKLIASFPLSLSILQTLAPGLSSK